MKIKVPKIALASALRKAKATLPFRANVPSLSCAHINAYMGYLAVTVTNLEQRITVTIACVVDEPGETLIAFQRLFDVVDKMGNDIEITTDEKQVAFISCGNSTAKIFGLPAAEFPPFSDENEGAAIFTERGEALALAIKKVLPAVCKDETRYIICGVNFVTVNGRLTLQASDGRRAHQYTMDSTTEVCALVPTDAATSMAMLFEIGEVRLSVSSKKIFTRSEKIVFESKLIEGKFPNMAPLIPPPVQECDRLTVDRQDMLDALDIIAPMIDQTGAINISSNRLSVTLTATTAEVGAISSAVDGAQKKVTSINLNGSFLKDALDSCGADEVNIENESPEKALAIRDGNLIVFMMPMRA